MYWVLFWCSVKHAEKMVLHRLVPGTKLVPISDIIFKRQISKPKDCPKMVKMINKYQKKAPPIAYITIGVCARLSTEHLKFPPP